MTVQPTTLPSSSEATAIEQARAVAEVAAAVKVAQDFPRDVSRAVERMRQACGQRALAERAFFSLPRAGGRIEGTTVHVARSLVACWGNTDYGIRELRRDDVKGESEMQAWAWDQETNVRSSRSFIVPHAIMAGKGVDKKRKTLVDLADITNNNNSVAARAVRETIFTVLPVWFRVEAENVLRQAIGGGDKPLEQRIADAVAHFANTYGVTREQLVKSVGRPTSSWTVHDVTGLTVLAGELSRGEKRVDDEFPNQVTAAEITAPTPQTDATASPRPESDPPAQGVGAATPPVSAAPTIPSGEPITEQQMKLLQKLASDLGLDRQQRMSGIASVIGRELESSKDLTKDEARQVIDALQKALNERAAAPPPSEIVPDAEPLITAPDRLALGSRLGELGVKDHGERAYIAGVLAGRTETLTDLHDLRRSEGRAVTELLETVTDRASLEALVSERADS